MTAWLSIRCSGYSEAARRQHDMLLWAMWTSSDTGSNSLQRIFRSSATVDWKCLATGNPMKDKKETAGRNLKVDICHDHRSQSCSHN